MRTNPSLTQNPRRGISVIICCYNSSGRIGKTLDHLAAQKISEKVEWEVLLVDNASSDNTSAIAFKIWNDLLTGSSQLRVVYEPNPGQQHARMRGVKEAFYDILIFCDDDNWLDPDYLLCAEETMRMNNQIGAAGGQNIPATDALQYPDWFESFADKYALGIPAANSGDITSRGFVLGAGMVTRKKLFLEMYADSYPSLLKGRKGESLSTGDDFEYCKRLLLCGWKLYYDQRMILRHFIPRERLTISYRDRLMDGIYAAGEVINEYDLAIRVHNRYQKKNKWRLLLITPFRILLVRLGLVNRVLIDEQLTFFYLKPFSSGNNPVRNQIKHFIQGHS